MFVLGPKIALQTSSYWYFVVARAKLAINQFVRIHLRKSFENWSNIGFKLVTTGTKALFAARTRSFYVFYTQQLDLHTKSICQKLEVDQKIRDRSKDRHRKAHLNGG